MNDKLTIQNLAELLAEKHGMDKTDAENFVKEFFLLIEEALGNDKYVKVKGLGIFKLIEVDSRESVNINTGERFEIQGHTKILFTPDPVMKKMINRPFEYFEAVALNDDTALEDTPVEDGAEEVNPVAAETEVPAEKPVEEAPVEQEEEKETEPAGEVAGPRTAAEEKENSSTMRFFIGIVVLVVVLCAGAVTFMYYPDLLDRKFAPSEKEVADEKAEKPAATVARADSIVRKDTAASAVRKDTVASAVRKEIVAEVAASKVVEKPQPVARQETPAAAPKEERKRAAAAPFRPDSVSYKIVGTKETYTIREGETLTRVALRFYGTKALWPYIVKHNPEVIKNPNHVPYGTVVKIPELKKK